MGKLIASIVLATGVLVPGLRAVAGSPATAAHPQVRVAAVEYVVQPGDTLWGIAGRVAGDRDRRGVVDAIMAANDLHSPILLPGQTLALPRA